MSQQFYHGMQRPKYWRFRMCDTDLVTNLSLSCRYWAVGKPEGVVEA